MPPVPYRSNVFGWNFCYNVEAIRFFVRVQPAINGNRMINRVTIDVISHCQHLLSAVRRSKNVFRMRRVLNIRTTLNLVTLVP